MILRSARERVLQTLLYEAGGLAFVLPLYSLATGHTAGASLVLLIAVSIACMAWAAVHNTLFDIVEAHFTGRVASRRPQRMRILHAVSHEVTSIVVSNPVIMLVTGLGFWDALLIDIGLTIAYSVYAYLFNMGFDFFRPVAVPQPLAFAGAQPFGFAGARPPDERLARDYDAPRRSPAYAPPAGVHIMIDGYGTPPALLSDQAYLFKLMVDLPRALGFTAVMMPKIVATSGGSTPARGGYSGFVMLQESHLSFHAVPALGQVSIDLYCSVGIDDNHVVSGIIKSAFRMATADVYVQERGLRARPLAAA